MKKIALSILSIAIVGTLSLQATLGDVATDNAKRAQAEANAQTSSTSSATSKAKVEDVTALYGDQLAAQLSTTATENDYSAYDGASGERSIIVELESESLVDSFLKTENISRYPNVSEYAVSKSAQTRVALLEREQSAFISALNSANVNYTYQYAYNSVVNGVALTVNNSDLSKISAIKGVKNIIFSEQYSVPEAAAVSNTVNAYSTGIYDTTGISYTGEGVLVGILDTGLDYTHDAFQTMPAMQKLTRSDVAAVLDGLTAKSRVSSVTADNLYLNAKVPYQFDYADDDADVYPVSSSHGTHVAGIISGYDEVVDYEPLPSDDNMYFNTNENGERTFKGVAVDAQLAIFKVFSDGNQRGADTTHIIAALNDAVLLGVDVINMSLGLVAGFSRISDDDSINSIYDRIRETGIALIVAAGNSYSSSMSGTWGNTNLATNPDSGPVMRRG